MSLTYGESLCDRFSVLRDEALNCAEHGESAPGSELFEAILAGLRRHGETEPGFDLSLQDALSRRLAWGENPSAIAVDCDLVCQRLLDAILRSLPDAEEATMVISVVAEITCTASRHIARLAVQLASKERALERREMMVHRQLGAALSQQDQLISQMTEQLNT